MKEQQPEPWSLKPDRLGFRAVLSIGGGSLIAAFFIGTGDISIASNMGAKFGFRMLWTYWVLGIAAWALLDMSVRYFMARGRTPMSMFKEAHPAFSIYMFVTVIVCSLLGSYSQWNACAMVLSAFFPRMPLEIAGALSALAAMLLVFQGVFSRLEKLFVVILGALIASFYASAFMAAPPWREAVAGLIPQNPGPGWRQLFMANAGSMINAWLILIYPYTLMEKNWYSSDIRGKVNILHRVRLDYGWGILAAGVVALPIMAAAAAVAKPFGIIPRNPTDLSLLLEPVAGRFSSYLFLTGLFVAAWTSGVAWWLGGAYALLDIFNLPIQMNSRPMRLIILLFFLPSVPLLMIRINPVYQILVFAAFLAFVFPVIGLVLLWRVTRPDMGYFRWSFRKPGPLLMATADIFAIIVSVYVGWMQLRQILWRPTARSAALRGHYEPASGAFSVPKGCEARGLPMCSHAPPALQQSTGTVPADRKIRVQTKDTG